MMKNILLIQVRDRGDAMLGHEAQCMARRLSPLKVSINNVNAVAEPITEGHFDGIDGVIIGGSGDFSVQHPLSDKFVSPLLKTLDVVAKRYLPTFGICFGHQLIGYWLGQSVPTDPSRSELGTIVVEKTAAGQSHPALVSLPQKFAVHSGHSDVVTGCPDGCEVILSNDLVETQAFQLTDLPMMSVQFHPDMSGAEARARLLAYQEGFSDRIETDAAAFAEKFAVDRDESTVLLSAFFHSQGFKSQ